MARARSLSRHWLVPAMGVGASLPVVVATIGSLADGWLPVGDQGIIATRALDVFTSHMPLLGQYSEASAVSGHATYSPGPLLYWLLAVPARAGAPASLTLTMAVVNVACIVAVLAIVRRRGGDGLVVATAVALALMCRSLGPESLHDLFNPSAALMPFTLLVFVSWALACGDHRLLALAVLLASFAAQCHLAYALPGVALLAVGVVLGRPRRGWAAAGAVALICWIAPVVQQITERPGNFSAIVSSSTSGRPTEGVRIAGRALVGVVGVPPRFLRVPGRTGGAIGGISGRDYGDTRIPDVLAAPGRFKELSAALVLAALASTGILAARRGRRDLAAGALIGIVLCAALAANVAATPVRALNTLGYALWWGSVAGMWVWLMLAWNVWQAVPSVRLRVALAAVPALAVGAAVAAAEPPDAHAPFYRPTAALTTRLDAAIPPGETLWLRARGKPVVPMSPAIRFRLRQRGVRVLGAHDVSRLGSWYALDHRRFDDVVTIRTAPAPRDVPARLTAKVTVRTVSGPRQVSATVSSGRNPRPLARPRSRARPTRRATRGRRHRS
jgi:hypothetical protein